MENRVKQKIPKILFILLAFYSFVVFTFESMLVLGQNPSVQDSKFIPNSMRISRLVAISRESLIVGNSLSDINRKVGFYCSSLSAIGRAIYYTPFEGKLLLNWANIRQLLGTIECNQPYTNGDTTSVINMGLSSEKTNPSVVYSGGLLALWSGDLGRSRELFHQYLNFEMNPSAGQIQLIQSTILLPQDVLSVIPARFPQVLFWTDRLKSDPRLWYSEKISVETESILKQLQLGALNENRKLRQANIIPDAIYESNIEYILRQPLHDDVRRVVDTEAAAYAAAAGNNVINRFFLERSGLQSLSIVRSHLQNDRKPLKSTFITWGGDPLVSLDEAYNSVGFYLPKHEDISMVVFRGRLTGPTPQSKFLHVYVSDNNIEWQPLEAELKYITFLFHDYPYFAIEMPKKLTKKQYWKFQFDKNGNVRKFGDSMTRFVNVYGIKQKTN